MKTTFEKAFNFQLVAQAWAAKEGNANTKMGYAIDRMNTRVEKLKQEYSAQVSDTQIDHCAVDEKGIILKDERGDYRFTREGLKALNKALTALFTSECEIEPYIATQVPDDLTDLERERFAGFVLADVPVQAATEEANAATVQ